MKQQKIDMGRFTKAVAANCSGSHDLYVELGIETETITSDGDDDTEQDTPSYEGAQEAA